MAPIIHNEMPAGNLDLQRYVAQGDVATTGVVDARSIEQQNAFQPSLVQDSDKNKNNKWLKDLALNPSHIEIRPTTHASLHARDVGADNEPNAINCNSFGIRGGHRCQTIGDGLDIQNRIRKNHGQRHPKSISNHDNEPKLSRRERNNKGFESHPCENHLAGERGCSAIVSPRDRELSPQTISNLAAVGTLDHVLHKNHKPFRTMLGEYDTKEEAMGALDAHQAAIRARTATVAGIAVTVVVCVLLLGLVFWYLRKRSKKLAAARAEGRVAELELETRRKGGDARSGQAAKC